MGVNLKLEPLGLMGEEFKRPILIAGPCSAESEEQVMATARQLAEQGIHIFRAGIWKPRTRPNAFEGVGSVGLPWLKKVKAETGMVIAIEVANVKHLYEALKYGVDLIWIGARTTANPFAVQEIADTLQGLDIPVLIKNPVNPDVELWIGAIERINNAGITRLGAIHRGFNSYHESDFRNDPQWQIPIELKRRIPDLPLINDPSHICGSRERLLEISQKAMDLNYDGLIIESHVDPDNALSDPKQQVTPGQLQDILNNIVFRKPLAENGVLRNLEEMRGLIDQLDDKIIDIFERRMEIAENIGHYKKANNITILQSKRWDEILNKRVKQGALKGLSEEFIQKVFRAIHQESINHQTRVMNEALSRSEKQVDQKR